MDQEERAADFKVAYKKKRTAGRSTVALIVALVVAILIYFWTSEGKCYVYNGGLFEKHCEP